MPENNTEILTFATKQVWLYGSLILLTLGLVGNSINTLIFRRKLKTNPCSFYLLTGDIANSFTLSTNLLPIVIDVLYDSYLSRSILILCKIWTYLPTVFTTISILMLCLASIDRYCSTSRDVYRRQWSSVKVAKISISVALVASFLLSVPDLIYVGIQKMHCGYMSIGYDKYFTYFMAPVLLTILPTSILSIFACLTRRNIRKCIRTAHQTDAQRMSDQLTRMLFVQIVWFSISTLTLFGVKLYSTIALNVRNGRDKTAIESLIESIAFVIYSTYQCGSFYVYILTSATYRDALMKIFNDLFVRIARRTVA
jgi:hypothetical protein